MMAPETERGNLSFRTSELTERNGSCGSLGHFVTHFQLTQALAALDATKKSQVGKNLEGANRQNPRSQRGARPPSDRLLEPGEYPQQFRLRRRSWLSCVHLPILSCQ